MLFWLIAACLALAAALAVLVPLVRAPRRLEDSDLSHDLAVYRDQLAEIERDARRGLVGAAEANEARAEIGRRILKRGSEALPEKPAATAPNVARLAASAAVLAVPLLAFGLYGVLGSPGLPGAPLAARLDKLPGDAGIEELVARAEAHLAANPGDGRGWDVLAPIYLKLGRTDDAVTAFKNAIRVNGGSAERESGLGEALAMSAQGMISEEAEAAFRRALAIDAAQPKARFYLASALAQEGRMEDAAAAFKTMLADLPANSPWRKAAEQAADEAARLAEAGAGAPDQAAAAAQDLAPADRAAMISGMVASLDQKLRDNPGDPAGWQKLVRSYQVLGKPDAARDALARGLDALGPDSADGKALAALAASLGVAAAQTR